MSAVQRKVPGKVSRVRTMLNGFRWFELATVTVLVGVGGWIAMAEQTHEKVESTARAVEKIGEWKVAHTTKERYEDCEARCIPVAECPPSERDLPPSRCPKSR